MNKWTDFFDCIYVVNLVKRVDRLLEITEELEKFEIPYKRVSAIESSNGAEGLRDTMLLIFNEAIDQGHENILVFEDDAKFMPHEDVNFVMEKVVREIPKDYMMCFLGLQLTRGVSYFHTPNLMVIPQGFATHAVFYSRRCIDEIIKLGLGFPIDNWYNEHIIGKRGTCFATYPMLATQRPGVSDIGKTFIDWGPFMQGRFEQKVAEFRMKN